MVDTTPFAVGVRLTDLPLPDDAEVDATTDAVAAAGEESEDEEGGKAKKRELNRRPLLPRLLDSHTRTATGFMLALHSLDQEVTAVPPVQPPAVTEEDHLPTHCRLSCQAAV